MSPAQEDRALAYEEGVRNGSEITARELAAEIEGLRADLKEAQRRLRELAPMRQVLDALRRIHQNTERRPQTGNPVYWTLGSTALIATGPDANALILALNFASYDAGSAGSGGPK